MPEAIHTRYAIIGAGTAGIAAAEALRETDPAGDMVMIHGESVPPYCRPLIVELLMGERAADQILIRDPEWFAEREVTLLSGDPAVNLAPREMNLTLASGRTITWEKLLVATGAQPVTPPIAGLTDVPTLTLSTQEDVARFEPHCRPGARALLVGIGLLGLQAMTALKALGVQVIAVEARSKILPLILDARAAAIAQRRLEENDIEVHVGTKLTSVGRAAGGAAGCVARTGDGKEFAFDFLVLTTGMRPNLALLGGTGIASERGVVVTENMETNAEGVYAAGDVTQFHNWIEERAEVHAHWVNAYRQGRIAGTHMAGGQAEPYRPSYLNSLRLFGLPIITMGASRIDDPQGAQVHIAGSEVRPAYARLVVRQGELIAATFVNDVKRAGVFQYLMRQRIPIGDAAASLLAQDRTGMEFLHKIHAEAISGDVEWPASMDLIDRYRKDHGHTRWGTDKKTEKSEA
jgi:NAD(P)H-nitrite reductase large subunit